MTDNLTEQLRVLAVQIAVDGRGWSEVVVDRLREAADRIEQLEAALKGRDHGLGYALLALSLGQMDGRDDPTGECQDILEAARDGKWDEYVEGDDAVPVVSRADLAAAIEDYIEPVWGADDAAVAAIVVVLEAAGVAVTDKPEADLREATT